LYQKLIEAGSMQAGCGDCNPFFYKIEILLHKVRDGILRTNKQTNRINSTNGRQDDESDGGHQENDG